MTSSQLYFSIHSIWERDKEFPSVEKISKETGTTQSVINKALQYYLIRGKLNLIDGNYVFPKSSRKYNFIILILRIIMGVVGTGCIITSIKFTYSFNKLTMPKFWAFILSSSLIIFTSFCFTIRDVLKKTNKFQANIFVFLYFIGIIYSVFTAISGQYNDYLENNKIIIQNKIEESAETKKYDILISEKERYLIQIKSLETQRDSQQKIIDNLSESPERKFEYNNTWKQTTESVKNLNFKILELEDKVSNINVELMNSIENTERKTKNIFDWISDLLHISADILQFLISLFPAIFIDLVSPFAIAFAFNKNN